MYYGKRTVKEMDDYYKINYDGSGKYPWWQHKECEKIQSAFNSHAIMLTLAECKLVYEIYSDECYCAGWEGGIEYMSEEDIFELLLPWLKNIISDRVKRILCVTEQLEINGYLNKQ